MKILSKKSSIQYFEFIIPFTAILFIVGVFANLFIKVPEDMNSEIANNMISRVIEIELELFGPRKGRYFLDLSDNEYFSIILENFSAAYISDIPKDSSGKRIFDFMPSFKLKTETGEVLYINMYIDYDEPNDVFIKYGKEEIKRHRKYYYDENKYWITFLDSMFEAAYNN